MTQVIYDMKKTQDPHARFEKQTKAAPKKRKTNWDKQVDIEAVQNAETFQRLAEAR